MEIKETLYYDPYKGEKPVLLRVEHLQQYFKLGKRDLKAVDDVNFEVYKGEVFGLVGESGCGKTTTGRSIIRLYDITGGTVYFEGIKIGCGTRFFQDAIKNAKLNLKATEKQLKEKLEKNEINISEYHEELEKATEQVSQVIKENKAKIKQAKYEHKHYNEDFAQAHVDRVNEEYLPKIEEAETEEEKEALKKEYKEKLRIAKNERIMNKMQMIFQDPIASLDPRMTVHDIIAEGLIIQGVTDKEFIDNEVYRVLELVGLVPEHASRYPHEFSGGQRQRIGIARAIILNPDLIIADEPISALDVSIQAQVINLLNELRDKMGLTIMFIAHDLSVVKYFSDRIAVMYYGKIVEVATSDELFAHPLHPYTKSLLSAIPLPDPRYEKKRKRIVYNPIAAHDYREEGPIMREVCPGHLIRCNSAEFEKYQEEIKELDTKHNN